MEAYEHQVYFEALDRLKKNKPIRVPKGTRINNNNVSLEADRKVGSIKKSRKSFAALIKAIDEARNEQSEEKNKTEADVEKYKRLYFDYKKKYADALTRELGLAERLKKLEGELKGD